MSSAQFYDHNDELRLEGTLISQSASAVLQANALDIGTVAAHDLLWTGAVDNLWDANVLSVLPDGLGMTAALDGTDATITTTDSGAWGLAYLLTTPAGDAGYVGAFRDSLGLAVDYPVVVRAGLFTSVAVAGVVYLPSGATFAPRVDTTTAPGAQFLAASLVITRIA